MYATALSIYTREFLKKDMVTGLLSQNAARCYRARKEQKTQRFPSKMETRVEYLYSTTHSSTFPSANGLASRHIQHLPTRRRRNQIHQWFSPDPGRSTLTLGSVWTRGLVPMGIGVDYWGLRFLLSYVADRSVW